MERKQLLTTDQAAEWLNVSAKHVRRLNSEGTLPGIRLGRVLRFKPEALEELVERASK